MRKIWMVVTKSLLFCSPLFIVCLKYLIIKHLYTGFLKPWSLLKSSNYSVHPLFLSVFWFTTGEIIPPEWQARGMRTSNQLVEVGKVIGRGVGNLEGQFSSVAQSCLTLCDPMNHSTPRFPVHHQLPESTQTHVHWVSDAIQPSALLFPSPPALNLSQHQDLFKWVSSSHQVAKVLEFQLQHQSFQWTPRADLL